MQIKIDRAIPKRRYRLGAFEAVFLSEIEASSDIDYHYLLALVADGETEPVLYISCEKNTTEVTGGGYLIRVLTGEDERVFGPSDLWGDLEEFSENALLMVQKVMGLTDEQPMRTM